MKLRVVHHEGKTKIYCSNGTILIPTEKDIINLLKSFKRPNIFKGNDGIWHNFIANMEDAPGLTLAYIDDSNKLVILDEKIFSKLFKQSIKYISASEYADKHGKSRPSIKNMCAAGRIEGAYKTTSGWLIPENSPYPKDKRVTSGNRSTSKSSKNT